MPVALFLHPGAECHEILVGIDDEPCNRLRIVVVDTVAEGNPATAKHLAAANLRPGQATHHRERIAPLGHQNQQIAK